MERAEPRVVKCSISHTRLHPRLRVTNIKSKLNYSRVPQNHTKSQIPLKLNSHFDCQSIARRAETFNYTARIRQLSLNGFYDLTLETFIASGDFSSSWITFKHDFITCRSKNSLRLTDSVLIEILRWNKTPTRELELDGIKFFASF